MSDDHQTRVAISVTEMAAMVSLSRERFYQLIGSAFPHPVYDTRTRRPLYTLELQQVCLEVRQTNCGFDGRPVLFYTKKRAVAQRPSRPTRQDNSRAKETSDIEYPAILAAVRALGLAAVTGEQIAAAVQAAFPNGTREVEQGQIIRAVFVRLKRHNRGDIVA
ncbi:MAG: hypothetical protein NTY19_06705 [Planctomycetota bacterium]|nr:hypothetical protein [Planctomycetota bacterium]